MKRLIAFRVGLACLFLTGGLPHAALAGMGEEIANGSRQAVTELKDAGVETGKQLKDGAINTGVAIKDGAKTIGQEFRRAVQGTKAVVTGESTGGDPAARQTHPAGDTR